VKGKVQLHHNRPLTMISSGDRKLKTRKVKKTKVHKSRINFHSFNSLDQIHAIHGQLKKIIDRILSLRESSQILIACS
jgi:hypothetical protein